MMVKKNKFLKRKKKYKEGKDVGEKTFWQIDDPVKFYFEESLWYFNFDFAIKKSQLG